MNMDYITHVWSPLDDLVAPTKDADAFGSMLNFCERRNATSINEYSTMMRATLLMSYSIEDLQNEQM